jgi:TonB family protein
MRKAFASAAVLLVTSAVHAGDASQPVKVELSWRLTLDAQGHVTQLNAAQNQPVDRVPQIRTRMEREIRDWQFTSGKLDGRPAPTETALHLWVTIVPQDADAVVMHVDKVTTGATFTAMKAPRYPPSAVHDHITGQVVLRIGYDSNGKITSIEPERSAPKAPSVLVQSATKAVQAWTFQPELVGGHGRSGYVITPFCFTLTEMVTRHAEGKCDWKMPDMAQSVGEGEALALDPAARLLSDIVGHAL